MSTVSSRVQQGYHFMPAVRVTALRVFVDDAEWREARMLMLCKFARTPLKSKMEGFLFRLESIQPESSFRVSLYV